MKLPFLLWLFGLLLRWASRFNSGFRQELDGKDLSFQLYTLDGKVARHFVVRDRCIKSRRGVCESPAFALGFRDAEFALATLAAPNRKLAFMQGVQNRHIQFNGNPRHLLWFRRLVKQLRRNKSSDNPST